MATLRKNHWILAAALTFVATTLVAALALWILHGRWSPFAWALLFPGWIAISLVFGLMAPYQFAYRPLESGILVGATALIWTLCLIGAIGAAMYLRRCIRGPNTLGARLRVAAALALYTSLWVATATIGRSQVRAGLLSRDREDGTARLLESRRDARRVRPPYYWVDVTAPCPFLLTVNRGSVIGPLNAGGVHEWHVWLAGLHFPILVSAMWVS
jgi:hypothetical protein